MTAIMDTSAVMYTAGMAGAPNVPREMKIADARNQMAAIIDKARYFGGITYLTNRGKPVAAVIPADIAEWLEANADAVIEQVRLHHRAD